MDDTLFLVSEDDGTRIEVGTVDDIVDAVGGETYVIEYDDHQRTQPWLQTDDGVLEIDVREVATTLPHTEDTAAELADYDMSTERYGLPTRTVEFANRLVDTLERQGSS
ncbi:hypothetical protein HSB1_41000 [Halogranum salarium B-1]|uniref:Uncharacterized protein n=1 Tax=Halogranum salarium B-1 TaxID=1210908 RepID=J3JDS3_9EURY|nr:hypothetical protein HSB1_41000 [Halogranum salarium B-1]